METVDEAIARLVAEAPPFSPRQAERLRTLLGGDNRQTFPEEPPDEMPEAAHRADPEMGTRYKKTMLATPGGCQRCHKPGPRDVDHCHEHGAVRGLICRSCNNLSESNMGHWVVRCPYCHWLIHGLIGCSKPDSITRDKDIWPVCRAIREHLEEE